MGDFERRRRLSFIISPKLGGGLKPGIGVLSEIMNKRPSMFENKMCFMYNKKWSHERHAGRAGTWKRAQELLGFSTGIENMCMVPPNVSSGVRVDDIQK